MKRIALLVLVIVFLFVFSVSASAQEINYNRHILKDGDLIWITTGDIFCEGRRIYDQNGYIFPHLFGQRGCFQKAILIKKRYVLGSNEEVYTIGLFYSEEEMRILDFPVIRTIPQQRIVILNH